MNYIIYIYSFALIYIKIEHGVLMVVENQKNLIEIEDYKPEYDEKFREISYEWLQEYFTVEPIDVEFLSDPKKKIIDEGGHIFFGKYKDKIVGTCALLKKTADEFYLSKMAVLKKNRRKKIGTRLLEKAIETAKALGAKLIVLETNTKLEAAINLYKKFGFMEVPLQKSDFAKVNMRMQLNLNTDLPSS